MCFELYAWKNSYPSYQFLPIINLTTRSAEHPSSTYPYSVIKFSILLTYEILSKEDIFFNNPLKVVEQGKGKSSIFW